MNTVATNSGDPQISVSREYIYTNNFGGKGGVFKRAGFISEVPYPTVSEGGIVITQHPKDYLQKENSYLASSLPKVKRIGAILEFTNGLTLIQHFQDNPISLGRMRHACPVDVVSPQGGKHSLHSKLEMSALWLDKLSSPEPFAEGLWCSERYIHGTGPFLGVSLESADMRQDIHHTGNSMFWLKGSIISEVDYQSSRLEISSKGDVTGTVSLLNNQSGEIQHVGVKGCVFDNGLVGFYPKDGRPAVQEDTRQYLGFFKPFLSYREITLQRYHDV